jgi:dihydropteroate synthase-like protein
MPEPVLFLTGRLARPRLHQMLERLQPDFAWEVRDIGVKVAALMTAELIRRRLPRPLAAERVLLPGRFRGDLAALSAHYDRPFERGPDDLVDLPEFLGRAGPPADLSRTDVTIFAEIVDAPDLPLSELVARAAKLRHDGAEVIDLGCLPDTPFPGLEAAIAALKAEGHRVSVDSADPAELSRGGKAGADYLLSVSEATLDLAWESEAVPVLVPAVHGDLESLLRAMDALDARGRPYLADPILDPIHFGFTASIERYAALRRHRPQAAILMGTGNLTELTDADSTGVTALLMGIVSELHIGAVLVVQVSPHCRRAVAETDAARRMMFAAREASSLPVRISPALLCLRDRRPITTTPADIAAMAAQLSDENFRIDVAADGIHAYNRRGDRIGADPFALFPQLGVEQDGSHAFYLGVETARAEIAWRLGKRYVQDRPLDWGVAVETEAEDLEKQAAAGTTLQAARRERRR